MTKIVYLENKYNSNWDDYISQSPSGTFYHLLGWKHVLEKTYGFNSIYLMAISNAGEISGVLPLFIVKDIFGRKYLISSPFSDSAGACTREQETRIKLLEKAKKIAEGMNVRYLEIRQLDEKVYDWPTKSDFVTMHLKLNSDEEYMWKKSLDSKARNQVRKAYREGLTVDFGKGYIDEFYRVLSIGFREHGSPIFPKRFLSNIFNEFKEDTNLIVVKYKGIIIGGMFYLSYKKIFSDLWASSLKKYSNLCPNNILYWEAIKYACKKDFEYFNLGRSTVDSGTLRFKKQWGAIPVQLYYQYYLNKSNKMPGVSAHNNQYQMAINLWKKLPLPIANTFGPKLVRYLPEY